MIVESNNNGSENNLFSFVSPFYDFFVYEYCTNSWEEMYLVAFLAAFQDTENSHNTDFVH